jgi:hypothetical protein
VGNDVKPAKLYFAITHYNKEAMRAKMEGRDMPNQNYALPYAKGLVPLPRLVTQVINY